MKNDLISRSELKIAVWMDVSKGTSGEYMDGSECSFTSNEVQKMIDEAPTVDAAPVVHGRWIDTGRSDGNDNYDFVCCRCKHTDIHSRQVKVPYCWFCGARMDEQEET